MLDDFRFKSRMPSRASAVRELLKRGLASEGFDAAVFGAKSEDFGILENAPASRANSLRDPGPNLQKRLGVVR